MAQMPAPQKPVTRTQQLRTIKWAAPAILAIYPISQVCAYAVAHHLTPTWFYIWPALYSLMVMILLLASFARKPGRLDAANGAQRTTFAAERGLLTTLTILLVVFSALVPMLRDIKLPDPDMMRNLHYALSLCDAIFAFLILTGVIDLVSGAFFDPDDFTAEDEARYSRLRDSAVRRGYVTAVLGMGALYLVSQYQPDWIRHLLLPLIALCVAIPAIHILQRSGWGHHGN